MSIAPPPSNSSASSTTDTAPTYTTSKVLDGHQPNIPGSVSEKYNEGLEDPSKRPKENIHAQEDFIKTLPRKDVSFGAEAALDRDRVPLVKRTEVHAVPAETSQEHLLQDKHIEVSDVQIPPTQSQSNKEDQTSLESNSMSSNKENVSPSQSTQEDSTTTTKSMSPNESNSSKQDLPSMSTQQDVDKKQDAIEASTASFKDKLSKQDKQLEESATRHQQQLIAEKKKHEDESETETPQFKESIDQHNKQVEESAKVDQENINVKQDTKLPTPPTNESQTETSTAKKWEDEHLQPFDFPRTSEQASETREKPQETSKSSEGVLPTDQYDLKSESDSNKQESTLTETLKSSEHVIQEKLAGLVHTITHDLPTAAQELLNEYEASKSRDRSMKTDKSSSSGILPTDQYDLKNTNDTQQDTTDTSKSTNDKNLEEKHVEPFDDHQSEPKQHHFIQDKLAGLMHTVTHDLPARAKELLTKHEENKSQPPSPTQAPTIQEREEKQPTDKSGGSVIKERGFDPEEMLFL